jgi:D-alanine-D-alanine ligase-like ATP-grasp enzyme
VHDLVPRSLFRSLRLLDVPDVVQHLNFAKLRRRYYDLFWARAAAEAGAEFHKWHDGFVKLARAGTVVIVRGPEVRLDDHLTLALMGNKALTYELMAGQGIEVPRHVRFPVTNQRKALDLLNATKRPLVVKPNSGTGGGRGVTTGIATVADLRRAALWAARFDTDLIAEEQVEGASWRLLFLDGRFLDAVRRDPPRITGDGLRSIRELIKAENTRRLLGNPFTALSPIRIDRECIGYLAAQGLKPATIPQRGECVVLKRAANENSASENHSLKSSVHPATIAACARLAQNLGVRLAGIDVIARDISSPLSGGNGIIGEINTTPGLHHHDLISDAENGQHVAAQLLHHMFETHSGTVVIDSAQPRPAPQLRVAAG